MNKKPKMSLLSVATPVYVIARGSGGSATEEKVILSSHYWGQSFQFIPTDSTKRISRELRHKLLESFLWPAKS